MPKISKVIYGGKTLIDLTSDTVEASKLLTGYTAHGADGEVVNGTCDYDVNSSGATAKASEILIGKTAAVGGKVITGAMPNRGAVNLTIATKDGEATITQGYHDGSGKVTIDADEKAKLIATNIREGVTVLGITGTMSGTEGANPQQVTVTPSTSQDITVLPDADQGYNYLSQVTVNKIAYVENENTAGGLTATIG